MANRRRLFWIAFLGAAGALALIPEFFDGEPETGVQPVLRPQAVTPVAPIQAGRLDELRSPPPPAVASPASATAAPLATDTPPPAPGAGADPARPAPELFAAHSWYVPPPPPPPPPPAAPPPPPPAPVAPALPYEYLGKLAEGGRVRVFLVRGDRPYTVSEGDVLDGSYKVKRITDTDMTLVYLPLDQSQTLPVGSKP